MQSTNEPQTIVLDTLAIANMVPQVTPDYGSHKLLMYESVLHTKAQRVLETGTDVGDSARIFATALRRTGGVIFTIDKKTDLNLGWMQEYPNVFYIKGDSLKIPWNDKLDFLHGNDVLDLLYIDSEHTKEQVSRELRKFGPFVRLGGVILIHDTVHNEFGHLVTEAIRTWCREVGLRWSEDPNPYGMGIIEVTRDLLPLREKSS